MTIQALKALAERTRGIDPSDPAAGPEHERTLAQLCELSEFVRANATAPAASCLLAACHALEALAAPDDVLAVTPLQHGAAALIDAVASTLEAAEGRAPGPGEGGPGPVRLDTAEIADAPRLRVPGVDEDEPDVVAQSRAASDDPLLGEILMRLGHVTQAQVDAALDMHRERGMAVGECLLMTGACAPERVLEALRMQSSLRGGPAREDDADGAPLTPEVKAHFHVTTDIFLGEVLLGAEMITKEQLEDAMRRHHLQGVRVGEALIALGALTEEELAGGIELQRSLQGIARKTARPPRPTS